MIHLDIQEVDGVALVVLPEGLTQNDFLDMRNYFQTNFFSNSINKFVVVCSNVENPPSIAYGVFCSLTRDALRRGGCLCFTDVNQEVQAVMERIHVSEQLNIYPDTSTGIKFLKNLSEDIQ